MWGLFFTVMEGIMIFDYKGSPVSFSKGKSVMINATQMAKPFGKSPKDFLKTGQTRQYIIALSEVKKILSPDLVKVVHGDNGGTWMHEDVALEFARWLSPAFAIWCNDRIKEMLTSGQTSISELSRKELAQMVIEAEEEKERLQLEVKKQADQLKADAPKVLFANALKASGRSILVGELAKILKQNGMATGQKRLFAWLRENGYLMKGGSERNQPTQRSMELGLFEVTKGVVTRPDDTVITTVTTKVTAKGQEYFINKLVAAKPQEEA